MRKHVMPYANNRDANQPAHLKICLDSMICILAISKVSVSVAEQAGLNVTWLKIPEDMFSRNVAQIVT